MSNGISASISELSPVDVTAELPGQISGPGLSLTITIANSSAQAVSAEGTAVDLVDSDGISGTWITNADAEPLTGSIAAQSSATGTYVYTVPADKRSPVTVYVTLAQGLAVVAFQGNAP